jgi:hypothetical protein
VIDDKDIDIVSIATYDDSHYEQVTRALGCGKYVDREIAILSSCRRSRLCRVPPRKWSSWIYCFCLVTAFILRGGDPLYHPNGGAPAIV